MSAGDRSADLVADPIVLGSRLGRLCDRIARRDGSVTLSQYQALSALARAYPTPLEPRELGRALAAGSAQVAALLDHLDRARLVERHLHARDRRRRLVHLTGTGLERVEAIRVPMEDLQRRIVARSVPADDAAALGGALARMGALVRDQDGAELTFLVTADPGREPEAM